MHLINVPKHKKNNVFRKAHLYGGKASIHPTGSMQWLYMCMYVVPCVFPVGREGIDTPDRKHAVVVCMYVLRRQGEGDGEWKGQRMNKDKAKEKEKG